jgi:hypothetical protein
MSGRISIGFVDLLRFRSSSFEFDRVRRHLARSFLVRNWCGCPTRSTNGQNGRLLRSSNFASVRRCPISLGETPGYLKRQRPASRRGSAWREMKTCRRSFLPLLDELGAFSLRSHRPPTSAHRSITRLCNE